MVRLKEAIEKMKQQGEAKFQFLHGTIKGETSILAKEKGFLFQFLHGTIKGFGGNEYIEPKVSFQFLHGTIKG